MRISFDIDDTLMCRDPEMPCERRVLPFSLCFWVRESLRLGARSLIQDLQKQGHEVWIYTSSLRPPMYIRLWLLTHGVQVQGIINQDVHDRTMKRLHPRPTASKYPPAFGIQFHVDDSQGVLMEAEKHSFRVIQIDPQDTEWTARVLHGLQANPGI
jgi:hypothetical protein